MKADRLYGRSVLKIEGGRPALAVDHDETARLCNECLGCEIHCELRGSSVIKMNLPLPGLDEYRRKIGLSK